MTESTNTPGTPEGSEEGGPSEDYATRPDQKEVRGNPPVDEEAAKKGEENLGRIKPY
jgi:hypothetical protein